MKSKGNEKEQEMLKQLRDSGVTVYSISRLNSYNNCKYEYYQSYINKNRGLGSCYTEMGTLLHDTIESIYRNEVDLNNFNFTQEIHNKAFELELMDMDFMNDNVKNSFMGDVLHFASNFKKLDGDFELEKMFIAQFGDVYLHGYIDAIRGNEDETTDVIDWKTSSKFSGSKLTDAGRQLIIYKLGLEQVSDIQINKVMWMMLKYIYICHVQKNGKTKKKMVNRNKLIKEMKNTFEKELAASGMDDIEIMMMLDEAEKNNDFESLPQVIKDKFWLEDCLLEYEVTEDKVKEVENYIQSTVKEIENMDIENEDNWFPLNIEKDGFYCSTLCGQRETCKHLKQYKKDNPFKKVGF